VIVCVNPNVSVDHTLIVPTFDESAVLRTDHTRVVAGGKGLNVARSLRVLGQNPLVVGMIGGHTGRLVAALAQDEGMDASWTEIARETRTCVIIVSRETGLATVINEVGPSVTAKEWSAFEANVVAAAARSSVVCISGSLPPGVPAHKFGSLIAHLVSEGVEVYVDAQGDALASAVASKPAAIKVNAEEAGGLLGRPVATHRAAEASAKELLAAGIRQVLITLGQAGAVLADSQGVLFARAPSVPTISAVGSGDAFLAAYVAARTDGLERETALGRGVAAGAANAQSPFGGSFQLADFNRALAAVSVDGAEPSLPAT
jgi:1-phosphofructokinase family hexose kinase